MPRVTYLYEKANLAIYEEDSSCPAELLIVSLSSVNILLKNKVELWGARVVQWVERQVVNAGPWD